ncbi:hypothetical protein ACLOJK_023929 [Asimina triloba]
MLLAPLGLDLGRGDGRQQIEEEGRHDCQMLLAAGGDMEDEAAGPGHDAARSRHDASVEDNGSPSPNVADGFRWVAGADRRKRFTGSSLEKVEHRMRCYGSASNPCTHAFCYGVMQV